MGRETKPALFQLLDQVCSRISALDVQRDAPAMLQEIQRARPDFAGRLNQATAKSGAKSAAAQVVALAIASYVLTLIKDIPAIVQMMVDKVNDRSTDPAVRCALVGVLAYLVQPRDLIPDDTPGGYGFVDDAALLRAGLIEYLNLLPPNPTEAEKQRDVLQSFGSLVPLSLVPALQQAVQGMSMAFQLLNMLPPELIDFTTQQMLMNPLQMTAPQAPTGFSPPSLPSLGGGHWSGGAYFEGGNVVMPGGASLIDGQLFIPD